MRIDKLYIDRYLFESPLIYGNINNGSAVLINIKKMLFLLYLSCNNGGINMKKIIVVLMVLLALCACTGKKEEPPVDNPPAPADNPAPTVPVEEKEYVYQIEKQFIVYDFELLHLKQTYEIKDGLKLSLAGQKKEARYCQNNPCILYEEVTINDKDIALFENMDIKINSDYGTLTMYNLNDELYLLNFNYAAMYNGCCGIVFSEDGELIMTYEDCDLSMNEIYQNQFGLSHTDENGKTNFDVYEANGKTLKVTAM